jgi:hypothetical protein
MSSFRPQHNAQPPLKLAAGTVLSTTSRGSRWLSVRTGYVWLTQEGRSEDYWLHAGDAILLQPGQLVVIEAAIASEIVMEPQAGNWLMSWCRARLQGWRGHVDAGLEKRGLS